MIRPFTCACFLLACGSGLYLYQSKHRVQVLDRAIEKTVHDTEAVREQTRVLHAEWTLLNDPERLQALADQFLTLKTVAPGQFTSMAELDNRLPPVGAPAPAPSEATSVPVAETTQPAQPASVAQAAVAAPPEQPPQHQAVQAAAPPSPRPPDHRPPPRPMLADAAPARPVPPPARAVIAADFRRPPPPRIVPAALPVQAPLAMPSGSALGMARSTAPPPLPRPFAVSPLLTSGGGG